MALPQTLVPTSPAGSDSPQGGDDQLRGIKQFLADVFGLPVSPTSITNAVSAITAAGEMSRRRGPIKAVVAAYSLSLDDEVVLLNKATSDTITPLAAASAPGKYYKLKNINAGVWTWSGTVVIYGTSTVNPTLAQNEELEIWCDGTTYYGLKYSATPTANTVPVSDAYGIVSDARLPESQKVIILRDTFAGGTLLTGNVGLLGWNIIGYAPNYSKIGNELVLNYSTAAISDNCAYIWLNGYAGILSSVDRFTSVLRAYINNTGTSKGKIGFGPSPINTDGDRSDVDGIYFHVGTTGNWFAITRASSTETATDTGIAPTTSLKTFKLVRRTTAQDGVSDVRFYIDGTLVATHTTNIPTNSLNPQFIVETSDTSAKTMYVSYFYLYQNLQ